MYKTIFFVLVILFTACSPDQEENSDQSPASFEVNVSGVTDRSATITWTPAIDPEGQTVNYEVTLIEPGLNHTANNRSYTFTGLNPESLYTGEVIATDGANRTTVNFQFTTQEFTPKIHNGYVLLTTQAEVDNFGAQGYNIINGSLGIESRYGPMTDIADLSPLSDLIEVKDYLRIRDSSLETLQGLNNLKRVGGYLGITYNSQLKSLEGLEGLQTIVENLSIHANPEIVNLAPLESVATIGEIRVGGNKKLINIRLLLNSLDVDHIYIYNNPSLETVEGFEKVQNIEFDLEITGNPELRTIPKFEELLSVNYGVYLNNNDKLENVDFPKLRSITYGLEIIDNPMLTKITGFNELRSVGRHFYIWNNVGLNNFCGLVPFANYGETGGMFVISGNAFNPSYEEIKAGNCTPG